MYDNPRRLRRPEERVGNVTNADLPPPASTIDDTLFARHYSAMMRVALNFVRTPEEAEEVIQETWIAVLAGIDKFEGRSSFKTWLFRILINRARTRAKREARSIPLSALAPDEATLTIVPHDLSHSAGQPDPEQKLLNGELREFLERAVASLPRAQRTVLSLRDLEGWSAEETCAALKISAGHQRVLLHRARMRVRELLMPYLEMQAGAGAGL